LAAAEDRGVVRPEPEQVLVSVATLHEDALHLSLAFHHSPLIRALFISEFVCVDSEIAHDVSLLQLEGPHAVILADHDRLVCLTTRG
jgi:hypothetical protein